MNNNLVASISITAMALAGCAATSVHPEAREIEIVNEAPDKSRCKFLGEVVGSEGNWFTGDYTSNKNLVVGARNKLKNETYALGGNVVYLEDMSNSSAWGSLGTTNTTTVGKAYKCES